MWRLMFQRTQMRKAGNSSAPARVKPSRSQGFTLLELLIGVAVFGIVMVAVYSVFSSANRVYASQEQIVAAQQEARSALEILGREIRMAGLIASDNQADGADPITDGAWEASADTAIEIAAVDIAAKTTTLGFKSDLDGNGSTNAVRYVYYHDDHETVSRRNTLTRQVVTWSGGTWADDSGEQLFLENIQTLTLTYELTDGTTSTTPADMDTIRGVVISLVAQTANELVPYNGGRGIRQRQLVSHIQIRNMGLS
jgi:prepilin-type N-terminal cleavage/methylation domain-containing protein